jgi:hypothetical protein
MLKLPITENFHAQKTTIEYNASEYKWARYGYALARRRGDTYSRRFYYFSATWPFILMGLGAISAFAALKNGGSLIFLIIGYVFVISALRQLFNIRTYDRATEDSYFPRHLDRTGTRTRLEISETGIRELQGDVVLSAGWRDVVSTILEEDLLIISLKGSRKILIPRSSGGNPDLDLEDLQRTFKRLSRADI